MKIHNLLNIAVIGIWALSFSGCSETKQYFSGTDGAKAAIEALFPEGDGINPVTPDVVSESCDSDAYTQYSPITDDELSVSLTSTSNYNGDQAVTHLLENLNLILDEPKAAEVYDLSSLRMCVIFYSGYFRLLPTGYPPHSAQLRLDSNLTRAGGPIGYLDWCAIKNLPSECVEPSIAPNGN